MYHIASTNKPPELPACLSLEAHDFLLLCFNRVPKERPNAMRLLKHPWLASVVVPSSGTRPQAPPTAAVTPTLPTGQLALVIILMGRLPQKVGTQKWGTESVRQMCAP